MDTLKFLNLPGEEGIIKGYKILRHLGGGAQGQIYLARNESLNRLVALKLFGYAFSSLFYSPKDCLQEARNVAQLDDEHRIITIHNLGTFKYLTEDGKEEECYYIEFRHIEGKSINDTDLTQVGLKERMKVFSDLCEALKYAHSKHIFHFDVSTSNVMVKQDENGFQGILIDFGISQKRDDADAVKWDLERIRYILQILLMKDTTQEEREKWQKLKESAIKKVEPRTADDYLKVAKRILYGQKPKQEGKSLLKIRVEDRSISLGEGAKVGGDIVTGNKKVKEGGVRINGENVEIHGDTAGRDINKQTIIVLPSPQPEEKKIYAEEEQNLIKTYLKGLNENITKRREKRGD